MNLAAILGFFCVMLLPLHAATPEASGLFAEAQSESQTQNQNTAPETQRPAAPDPGSSQGTSPASPSSPPSIANPKQQTATPKTRRKKRVSKKTNATADCAGAPAPLAPDANAQQMDAPPAGAQSAPGAPTPCPPPKKVVRNGSSAEPAIQLVGGTTDQQAANERSTEQLTTATEDNLKKIAGRRLSASEQESVEQIKEYMEQSKQAVAAGDAERAHNLAQKARLLSDQLVKP